MNVLASTEHLTAKDAWDWSSPIGLGVFIVGVALTLALLAWTIKTLAAIDKEQSKRK